MELTDAAIRETYGSLLARALVLYATDPDTVIEMAECAASIKYRREVCSARADAQGSADVKARTAELLGERGIVAPPKKRRGLLNGGPPHVSLRT